MSPDPRRRPVSGTDLIHTIHGESVLTKTTTAAGAAVSPRRRKHHPRPSSPRYLTVLSILTKNCLLLAALLYLGNLLWRWDSPPLPAIDYDNRVADLESSLKTTAGAIQLQLEATDSKFTSKIYRLNNQVQIIAQKTQTIDTQIDKLAERGNVLEMELKTGVVLKSEIEALYNEVRKSGGGELDEERMERVRVMAREIVRGEIERHAADGLGRVDYALGSGGGRVVRHSEPYGKGKKWFGGGVDREAGKMLEPSFGEPGQCFALKGREGFVEVRLRTLIVPEAITLEHVSKSVAYQRSSAPKDCRVSGWLEGPGEDPSNRVKKMALLTEFSYDLDKSNAQTFNVELSDQRVVNFVRLDFSSNHGSSDLTCIYRLRVHGAPPSVPLPEVPKALE